MGLGPVLGASWSQHGTQTFQLGDKMALRPPTWSQHGSQTCQLGRQMASRPLNLEHKSEQFAWEVLPKQANRVGGPSKMAIELTES